MMVVCSRQKPIIKQTDQNKTPLQHMGNISLDQLRMFQTIFFTTDFKEFFRHANRMQISYTTIHLK